MPEFRSEDKAGQAISDYSTRIRYLAQIQSLGTNKIPMLAKCQIHYHAHTLHFFSFSGAASRGKTEPYLLINDNLIQLQKVVIGPPETLEVSPSTNFLHMWLLMSRLMGYCGVFPNNKFLRKPVESYKSISSKLIKSFPNILMS